MDVLLLSGVNDSVTGFWTRLIRYVRAILSPMSSPPTPLPPAAPPLPASVPHPINTPAVSPISGAIGVPAHPHQPVALTSLVEHRLFQFSLVTPDFAFLPQACSFVATCCQTGLLHNRCETDQLMSGYLHDKNQFTHDCKTDSACTGCVSGPAEGTFTHVRPKYKKREQ